MNIVSGGASPAIWAWQRDAELFRVMAAEVKGMLDSRVPRRACGPVLRAAAAVLDRCADSVRRLAVDYGYDMPGLDSMGSRAPWLPEVDDKDHTDLARPSLHAFRTALRDVDLFSAEIRRALRMPLAWRGGGRYWAGLRLETAAISLGYLGSDTHIGNPDGLWAISARTGGGIPGYAVCPSGEGPAVITDDLSAASSYMCRSHAEAIRDALAAYGLAPGDAAVAPSSWIGGPYDAAAEWDVLLKNGRWLFLRAA